MDHPAHLIERAELATGLHDFGTDSFREGLELLCRSKIASGVPEALQMTLDDQFVAALANRLQLTNYIASNPAVKDERVERPLFIFGMPRSGTTLASYLLDQDPARRSLLLWEARNSAPPATSETLRTDPRCLAMIRAQQREFAVHPNEVRPHVEFPDGPTECIQLHMQDFKACAWEALFPPKEYSRWLLHADMTSAYEYEKAALQVLQSKAPGVWSLKMPSHGLHIEALYKVFPDARFVWVHRDPYRALASLFSMKTRRWKKITGDASVEWMREHYTVQLREHVNRPLALRERLGADRFYDLHYADLVRDPIAAMKPLYAWAGDDFTPMVEAGMRGWLARNPQGRFGNHSYGLEEFGLTEDALEPYFRDYRAAFDIESEG